LGKRKHESIVMNGLPSLRWAARLVSYSFALVQLVLRAQSSLPIYTDSLLNGFQDWGWAAHDYANTSPVHSGTHSVAVTIDSPWAGLQIYHPDLNSSSYGSIRFWLNGGATGGQKVQVYGLAHVGTNDNAAQKSFVLSALPKNSWQQVSVPLTSLGVAGKTNFTGFVIQDALGKTQPTFYLDDIELEAAPAPAFVHLTVDPTQPLRSVDARWFGVNTAIWDSSFDTPETITLLQEMGTRVLRAPGGSLSDEYHWSTDTNLTNTWRWAASFGMFTHVATNIGAQAFITVNYGTGSPNEAAAWVAYANGSPSDATPLGTDARGNDWRTIGYWASIRAAVPSAHDDGKNFLRLSRAAPLGFQYWEIGNECYGSWETDSNTSPHDPYTYATRARDYLEQMKSVDPTIKVGIVGAPGEDAYSNGYRAHPALNSRTGQTHDGWLPVLLSTLKQLGVTPDFLVHHRYPEYTDQNNPTGSDNDAALLQDSTQWAIDARELRQEVSDYFGSPGARIEFVCTENNSDAGAQGKQSTSLVNGLYYADSLAQLMQTEFNAFLWWDLRNGTDTTGSFDSSLYGWRPYGDLGMINGLDTRHPTFYAAKLMQSFALPGGQVVRAASDYALLSVYASEQASGALNVLVLNKDPSSSFNGQLALTGFVPGSGGLIRSYGIPQDEAARTNAPALAQDVATNTFAGAAANFAYSFPPLSITLLTLPPLAPELAIQSASGGQIQFTLRGQPGARYVIQNSLDLRTWTNLSTNWLSSSMLDVSKPVAPGPNDSFWRASWQP
jgi:alpha-N-arabinofuranosidase